MCHVYTTGFSPSVVTTVVTIGIELEALASVDKAGRAVAARFFGGVADAVLEKVDRVFNGGGGLLLGRPRGSGKLPAGKQKRICSMYIGMLSSHITKIIRFILL